MAFRGALRKKLSVFSKKGVRYPQVTIKEPKHLIVFPNYKKLSDVDLRYPLLEPFVYAHILWNPAKKSLEYIVEEPVFTDEEKKIFRT